MVKKSTSGNNYSYHPASNGEANVAMKDPSSTGNGCCSISCLQFSLHLFNAFFLFSGLVLAGVGLWTLLEKHPSLAVLTSGFYDLTGYVLVGAGFLIVLTSILGCCALFRSSSRLTLHYAILMAILVLVEASAGVFAYLYRSRVSGELADNLKEKFQVEYGVIEETTKAVDHLQISLSCCGIEGYEDWNASAWYQMPNRRSNKVPDSCCISPGRYCGVRDHPSNIRYTGCIDRMSAIAGDHLLVVGAVALGVGLLQLVGVLMAFILRGKLRALTHYSG